MDILRFYLVMSILFALGNIAVSAYYFIKIKEVWRYIKLFYIIANTFVFVNVLTMSLGYTPDDETRIMGLMVLLASQFSGLLVSVAKVKAADKLINRIKEIENEITSF